MAIQHWAITDAAGNLIDQIVTLGEGDTPGSHPRFHGYPWESGGAMVAHMVDRQGDLPLERFDAATGQWIKQASQAETIALRQLDQAQDKATRSLADLAVVVGELQTWREIQDLKRPPAPTDADIGALTAAQRQARWPFLIALMTESGTPLANFRAFVATAEAELAPRVQTVSTLAARAMLARRAVRNATDAAAKLAAAAVDLESGEPKAPPAGSK